MKKSFRTIVWSAVFLTAVILFDQWTKYLAVLHLKEGGPVVLIPGVLELRYLENQGAAFGMLQQRQTFFLILTIVVVAGIALMYLFRIPDTRRFLPLNLVALSLFAGAVGNFIDRARQQYVVDFIYFRLIDFPIFNVADCFVSVGAVCLFLLVLFFYRDDELNGIL